MFRESLRSIVLRRRRYLGHIYRYPEERIVRQSLGTTWNAKGRKKRGKKKLSWMAMIQNELKAHPELDLSADKREWKKQVELLCTKDV